jgi:hypothetical protein
MAIDENEFLCLRELIRATRARIRSTREQLARTSDLLMRQRRERLRSAVETLSPQDRQYAAIRAWIDRNSSSSSAPFDLYRS